MNSSIEDKLREATHMPQPRPEFLAGLRLQLAAGRPQPVRLGERLQLAFRRTSTVVIFSVLTILLAAFVIIGPQKVIAAVQQLIGYVPGIGFVENTETVRVLAEPVSVTQDGVTMTVDEAVVDVNSTRINVRVDGLQNARKLYARPGTEFPVGARRLVLPGGTEVALRSWGFHLADTWITMQLLYDPLPENVSQATLIIDSIPEALTGKALKSWELPLQFRSGKTSGQIQGATQVALASLEMNGITLILDSVALTDSMDVLKVGLQTKDPTLYIDPSWVDHLQIVDRDGRYLSLMPTTFYIEDRFNAVNIETPILIPGELYTLKLQGPIVLYRHILIDDTRGQFSLDLGGNPQPGQSLNLDQMLSAGGHSIHLTGAHLTAGDTCGVLDGSKEGVYSLAFDFDLPPGVTSLMVGPVDETPKASRVYQNACILYPEIPNGLLTFKIHNVYFPVEGNWEITWQAPEK